MPNVLEPAPAVSAPSQIENQAKLPWLWIATAAVAAAGLILRLCHWAAFRGQGFDESLYAHYLSQLIKVGLGGYPDIVDAYLVIQQKLEGSILPPTRFLYIFCAYLWHGLFGGEPLACFYAVSRVFSVGTLAVAGLFARRLFPDRRMALGVFALMAFSPLQIHMAQHALADGFFEFFVLLTLWAIVGKSASTRTSRMARGVRRWPRADGHDEGERVLRFRGGGGVDRGEQMVAFRDREPGTVGGDVRGSVDRRGDPHEPGGRVADAAGCLPARRAEEYAPPIRHPHG